MQADQMAAVLKAVQINHQAIQTARTEVAAEAAKKYARSLILT
jgi:hypothetical protein